jgi:hypothetical protein
MIDEQAIIELHPDLEDGLWLEWDTDGGATAPVRCSFCGEPVIEGYYNPRTGQYACRANLDFEAPMPLPVAITIIVLSILDGTLTGLVFTQWFFKKFIHKQ